MSGTYAYTPSIWPSILMVLLMVALAGYSSRRLNVPGAAPLMIASVFAAAWAFGSLFEAAAMDAETKIFWFKFQAIVQLPLIVATTCFVLEYAWPGRWLTRRNLALLFLPVLAGVVLILTDGRFHLAWRGFVTDGTVQPQLGLGSWLSAGYYLGILGALNLIVFGWLFVRSPQQRWPVVLMLVGQLVGRTLFLLERLYFFRSVPPLDLLGMSFEFLMYAIALFAFRIFDPIPLARRTAIEQLHSGMLVLDSQGVIVSLNPAAAAMLGLPTKRCLGRSIQEMLPSGFELAEDLQATVEVEVSLGYAPEIRFYQLEASALNDWRGLAVGRLLLLHDITDQKRAQAQILEQQRALATLTERERLARELHDSLGQVLGFTSLSLGAVRKTIADGKLERADNRLAQLENIVIEAHADVREYILDLRIAPTREQPFFTTLQSYLNGFRQNYDIQVEVSVGRGVDDTVFTPEAQVQLFHILQEAFSNARKHAGTECLQVWFEKQDDLLRMSIQDKGRGFDPTQASSEGHFGLRFMRERAEQIGGCIRVDSAPGKGTCVVVELPLKKEPNL